MTDPVVPTQTGGTVPPQAGGANPPPAFPPAPAADATGRPLAGEQPVAFPAAVPVPPGTEPAKKSGVKKKVLSVLGAILIFVLIGAVKSGLGALLAKDPTGDAKAGSCIAIKSKLTESATEVDAETTDCGSADAQYTVLGRVDGVSDVNGAACDPTFEATLKEGQEGFVIGSTEDDGYLLCLTRKV